MQGQEQGEVGPHGLPKEPIRAAVLERCRAGGLQRKRKTLLQVKALVVLGIISEMVPRALALCWLQGALRDAEQRNPVGREGSMCKHHLWAAWGWVGRHRGFLRSHFGGNTQTLPVAPLSVCQVPGLAFPLITCKVSVLLAAAHCFHYLFFYQHCSSAFKDFTNKPQITVLLCSKCGLWRPQFPHLSFTATAHHIMIA